VHEIREQRDRAQEGREHDIGPDSDPARARIGHGEDPERGRREHQVQEDLDGPAPLLVDRDEAEQTVVHGDEHRVASERDEDDERKRDTGHGSPLVATILGPPRTPDHDLRGKALASPFRYHDLVLATSPAHALGALLREWRLARRLTQQELADRAEVSVRHLSFLETGRAGASREMVLVLANALDLPLRERNLLLGAAGFAPAYRETSLDAAPMAHVRRALDHLLAQQEPFPGIVLDRSWNVLRMNAGAQRLFARFIGPRNPPPIVLANLAHALFHPEGLRSVIVDWPQLASAMAERLHREAAADPSQGGPRALRDAVLAYQGIPERLRQPRLHDAPPVALPLCLRAMDGAEVRFFITLTTLGTPLDVTAEELRIESYFPADDATDSFMRSLAG